MANNARGAAGREPVPLQIQVPGLEIGPGDTVVDVGCGDGTVCAYAGRLGAEVIGIDIDEAAVRQADEAMRGVPARAWRGVVSDCDPIPLPDGSASVVIATEVLEHVPDPPRMLAELARVGRPGARYVIAVPDPVSESLMGRVAPGWYWRPPFHVHVFERAELEGLIRGAGLEVVARAARGFPQAVWWAFRMALGPRVNEPTPDAPLLAHWEAAWAALMATPRGPRLAEALDALLPKSQVVLARKPGGGAAAVSSFGGPAWSRPRWRSRWRRRVRDGAVRLAGFDVSWSVRRAPRPGG
jgi:SAM-dependent methyltransferase